MATNKDLYKGELKRIKRQIKRLQNRGFIIKLEDVVKSVSEKPSKRDVESLKKKDLTYLYKHSKYVDPKTGEFVSGVRGREIERSEAAKKGAQTRALNKLKASEPTIPYEPESDEPESDTGYPIQFSSEEDDKAQEYELALKRLEEYMSRLYDEPNETKSKWSIEQFKSDIDYLRYNLQTEHDLDERTVAYNVYNNAERLNQIVDGLYEESRTSQREALKMEFLSLIAGYGLPQEINERYTAQG